MFYIKRNDNDLVHYGVLGMRWGIRRYQNPDGSLTRAGQVRYQRKDTKQNRSWEATKKSVAGTILAGPIGGLVGTVSGLTTDIKKINEKHLRNDMGDALLTQQNYHAKYNKLYTKKEQKNALDEQANAYMQVKKNSSYDEAIKAAEDSYKKAKRNGNIVTALTIAVGLGLAVLPVLHEKGVFDKTIDNFRGKDVEYNRKVMNGKVWTKDQIKDYLDIDINDLKSVGNDWDDKD